MMERGITIARGGRLLADQLLSEVIAGQTEIRLGHACREMDRLCKRDAITFGVKPASISRLLRARGWQKSGMTGSGYDREPLYRAPTA